MPSSVAHRLDPLAPRVRPSCSPASIGAMHDPRPRTMADAPANIRRGREASARVTTLPTRSSWIVAAVLCSLVGAAQAGAAARLHASAASTQRLRSKVTTMRWIDPTHGRPGMAGIIDKCNANGCCCCINLNPAVKHGHMGKRGPDEADIPCVLGVPQGGKDEGWAVTYCMSACTSSYDGQLLDVEEDFVNNPDSCRQHCEEANGGLEHCPPGQTFDDEHGRCEYE